MHTEPRAARLFLLASRSPRPGERGRYAPLMNVDLNTIDALTIPKAESDTFEFKSSLISQDGLKKKLSAAASGFSNSGGGYFIAGVDDKTGDPDGGIPNQFGRTDLRDWVDQVVNKIEPRPNYEIKLIDDVQGRGTLNPDCSILVVGFNESRAAPHMATDGKYYLRAGAHTETARHYLLEAIWAKRYVQKPSLTHNFRRKPNVDKVQQLGVVNLTNSPALDVQIELTPEPPFFAQNAPDTFPLNISLIDQQNPFYFDVCPTIDAVDHFGNNIELIVKYSDMFGNAYELKKQLQVTDGASPLSIGKDALIRIADSTEQIRKHITKA